MKKVILVIAALVLVASGVAAVSAYEAHVINVKAHVENALTVNTANVDFGTVFPEEFIKFHRGIGLSTSAISELGTGVAGDLKSVEIRPYAEWKAVPAGVTVTPVVLDAQQNPYYAWLGECLYVGFDPTQTPMAISGMTVVGPALAGPLSAQPILTTKILDTAVRSTQLGIAIDTPVFEGYYNSLTDMLQPDGSYAPKPSGLDHPTWIIPKSDARWIPGGVDMGLDLKIQVINIVRW